MTIAQAFNDIAVAQGGTASTSGTIAGAIDALNDALAGSDQQSAQTIEDAVRLLGQNIGGGSSVTVESLTATENKTYTAPEGKAYSPVVVNVSGGGSSDFSTCKLTLTNNSSATVYAPYTNNEYNDIEPQIPSDGEYNIALYNGKALLIITTSGSTGEITVNTSGDIVEEDTYYYTISGDCALTLTETI